MILESRSIIFSDEELIRAMAAPLDEKGIADAPADIAAELNHQGEIGVRIKLDDGGEHYFGSKEVGVAVLNHCIDQGIPLPRGSYKELAIRGDHIALIVRLESGEGILNIETDEL